MERISMTISVAALVVVFFTATPVSAVNTCGGITSVGDPYPCCSNNGNCTFYAWAMAKKYWGFNLPAWGNASNWLTSARNAGYPIWSLPPANSIGVNTTALGGLGHVAWVIRPDILRGTVDVAEQICCPTCAGGVQYRTRPMSYFSGFIYKSKFGQ